MSCAFRWLQSQPPYRPDRADAADLADAPDFFLKRAMATHDFSGLGSLAGFFA